MRSDNAGWGNSHDKMSVEVTRGLTLEEQDQAKRQAIAFVFHPTPLQAATSVRVCQDQAQNSTLIADAQVWEMVRTSPLCGTSDSALERL
jgi:hypothetical protein